MDVGKVLLEEGKAQTVDTPENTRGSICDGWACFGKLRAASQDLRFGDPGLVLQVTKKPSVKHQSGGLGVCRGRVCVFFSWAVGRVKH